MATLDYGFRLQSGTDLPFKNNVAAPLTSADVGKPVKLEDTETGEIVLCSDGDAIGGIVKAVDAAGVTVRVQGVCECAPLAADTILNGSPCAVVAGTGGTVKYSATHGTARLLAYDSAKTKVYVLVA